MNELERAVTNHLRTHPLSIGDSATLYYDYLQFGGRRYSHGDVASLYFRASESCVYGIPMRRESKLVACYVNGDKVTLSHSSAFTGKAVHQMIGNGHTYLSMLTCDHRLQIMIDQIERDGYAERDFVRFAADGTITSGATTIDINRMYEQGEACKGREFKSFSKQVRSLNPYARGFGEKGLGLFRKKIIYDSCTDADVIDAVVEYLHNKQARDRDAEDQNMK